jgi:segregation and condensation protein B
MHSLTRRLEALLYISPRPVTLSDVAGACGADEAAVADALRELEAEYAPGRHGLELVALAGGYTLHVAESCEEFVREFAGAPAPDDLSPALLETLSVVAYLQPTTRAEVAVVRGVSSEWALGSLSERGLIEESGRADTAGSPILYRTTDRFLKLFGLRGLDDLPALGQFALGADDVAELRARLLANAERRPQ